MSQSNSFSVDNDSLNQVANTIRFLSADAVEKANSGHPGMPMGMAELASVLWLKYLKYNPHDPAWLGRDRFVLSNGHGSMLIYSMLHLAGYKMTIDDLKEFRQWDSSTPGHPESFMTEGVETTTGPLGQGIGNAVGMALAQKVLSARYSAGAFDPFAQKVWCFCGDGCLMEGISSEVSSLAGHLGLDNLILVYDDNNISIAGRTDLAFTEDVETRYVSYGFHTIRVDGHDVDAIDAAYSQALSVKDKPVIILAKTIIGKGSPSKADSYNVHGSPLGADEMEATKKALNWPLEPSFYVPDEVRALFAARAEMLKSEYNAWGEKFDGWKKENPDKADQFDAQLNRTLPADLEQKLIDSLPSDGKAVATRKLSEGLLQVASANVPALIGGSADLEPSTLTLIKDSTDIKKGEYAGKNIRFGVREHGMGAIMNGMSYYGSFIPYGSTFLCFLDYMKPSVRLAALSHLQTMYIYTHDSIFLGEDGPTHQPIEHLQMLRAMPNVQLFRPADGLETAVSYYLALKANDRPSALILTRQGLPPIERPQGFKNEDMHKGAYLAYGSSEEIPEITFVATGSEVHLAIEVAKEITHKKVRVVSMLSYELFNVQDEKFKKQLIPDSSRKVCVEAATTFGWKDMVNGTDENTIVIGMERFGASAPAKVLAEKFGLTKEGILSKIKDAWNI